jgi:hypothetical protein
MRLPILLSIALTLAITLWSQNVVPEATQRRLLQQSLAQTKLRQTVHSQPLVLPAPILSTVCAIPLLEAKIPPVHDAIARPGKGSGIDPKMVVAPSIPACPKR